MTLRKRAMIDHLVEERCSENCGIFSGFFVLNRCTRAPQPELPTRQTACLTGRDRRPLAGSAGDHPYKEDAFHQDASANYLDKDRNWPGWPKDHVKRQTARWIKSPGEETVHGSFAIDGESTQMFKAGLRPNVQRDTWEVDVDCLYTDCMSLCLWVSQMFVSEIEWRWFVGKSPWQLVSHWLHPDTRRTVHSWWSWLHPWPSPGCRAVWGDPLFLGGGQSHLPLAGVAQRAFWKRAASGKCEKP